MKAYDTAAGKRYRVRYRKPDHSESQKRGFRTKREAELFLASVEVSMAEGSFIDHSAGRTTVGMIGNGWLESRTDLKPSSVVALESAWRLHVEPRWGSIAVADVRHSDVQDWLARLSRGDLGARSRAKPKPKSPALVHRAYGILAAILDVAVRDRKVGSNVARGVALPRKVRRRHQYLTHEQVHRLAEAAGAHGEIVLVLAYTGLRWGELAGLRTRNVDLERRRLTVEENAVLVGGRIVVGTPKTHKRRWVPFPAFLQPIFDARTAGTSPADLVFTDHRGNHIITPTVRENSWLDRALVTARLDPMTAHDLRHTTASLAVGAGANVKAVQRMLGHASAAETLDTYADLFDDDLEAVAGRLDEAVRSSSVANSWPNVSNPV